jgi:hypothetical protein
MELWMKKRKVIVHTPFDKISALRAELNSLEILLRQNPRALSEIHQLPPPPSGDELRALVVDLHRVVYEFLEARDFLHADCVPVTLAVRSFLCALDDELRTLSRQLERLRRPAGPPLRWFTSETRDAFKTLGFDTVDLDNPPSEALVKKNYRTLSARYHPDRTHGHEPQLFIHVQDAWQTVQKYFEYRS